MGTSVRKTHLAFSSSIRFPARSSVNSVSALSTAAAIALTSLSVAPNRLLSNPMPISSPGLYRTPSDASHGIRLKSIFASNLPGRHTTSNARAYLPAYDSNRASASFSSAVLFVASCARIAASQCRSKKSCFHERPWRTGSHREKVATARRSQ
jgi:hypothetical protein